MEVAIFFGSKSDTDKMKGAANCLREFGIEFEAYVLSAHRVPEKLEEVLEDVQKRGAEVIIAGAGLAAHLPGVIASKTILPVVGVPLNGAIGGLDALYSIVQMPPGIPVATVAIDGGMNAAILAAKMLAMSDPELLEKLKAYSAEMKDTVQAKADRLAEVGYEEYLNNK